MENTKKFKLNGHIIRRILVSVFGVFVAISVLYVMFNVYSPNQNALGALCSVCMDILCMLILFIIIGSFSFGRYESTRTTRLFGVLLVATIWAMFWDFLNWAFDGSLEFGHLTFWFTLLSLCMGSVLACIFCLYLYSYMAATYRLTKMRNSTIVCAILNIISFIITFILAITGTAFQFVDGHYEIGALYDIVTVAPILTLLYITAFVIFNVKTVGTHDAFSVAGYIIFMIGGALIESSYRIGTTYVAVAIADIFIFVMLQNEIIALEKRKVQKWMKQSNTDELTGFYNRHAYESDMASIDNNSIPEDFVYVSVDVNSLKAVNDSLGHYAGDEMLSGAADCLKSLFDSHGKLYRIGGDEFIAIITAKDEFVNSIDKELQRITENWHGQLVDSLTLSCGYVTKKEFSNMTIKEMAILADQRMYEAKNEYYRRTGIDRRKK